MTQSELPLEWPDYDHYTIEIRKGPQHSEEVLREHTAKSVEEAENLIEALRDTYYNRNDVTWQNEEVDVHGKLYGLAPGGDTYVISVVPPLGVELTQR
jgi:hypothetical protein